MYCYEIGGVGFGFDTDRELVEIGNYGLFRIDEAGFDSLRNRHFFSFSGREQEVNGKEIFKSSLFSVYENDDGYVRVSNRFDEYAYKIVFTEKKGTSGGIISFTDNGYRNLKTTSELFEIIDTMSALLYYDALMFHASFIEHDGNAILFSGAPGAGKSTQAEIWKKYKGANIINGDRAIIRLTENGWVACGNPACGSSNICVNRNVPLDTIAFVKQSPVNKVNGLTEFDKFMRLTTQLSCGVRKKHDTEKLMSLTERLGADVRVVELECTADERAADVLFEAIGG